MIAGQRSIALILKSHQPVPCIQLAYKCLVNDRHHKPSAKNTARRFGQAAVRGELAPRGRQIRTVC